MRSENLFELELGFLTIRIGGIFLLRQVPVVRVRVLFVFLSDLLFLSPVLVYIRFYVRSGVQFWFVSVGLVLGWVQIGCPFFLPCVRRPFSINTYVSN